MLVENEEARGPRGPRASARRASSRSRPPSRMHCRRLRRRVADLPLHPEAVWRALREPTPLVSGAVTEPEVSGCTSVHFRPDASDFGRGSGRTAVRRRRRSRCLHGRHGVAAAHEARVVYSGRLVTANVYPSCTGCTTKADGFGSAPAPRMRSWKAFRAHPHGAPRVRRPQGNRECPDPTAGTFRGTSVRGPNSDPMTLLTALGARLEVAGPEGVREIDIVDFARAPYETALEPDERLLSIRVVAPTAAHMVYERIVLRERPGGVRGCGSDRRSRDPNRCRWRGSGSSPTARAGGVARPRRQKRDERVRRRAEGFTSI